MNKFEKDIIKKTSIPLPGGGDTHIHPHGKKETDFTITTRLPSIEGHPIDFHDKGKDISNK